MAEFKLEGPFYDEVQKEIAGFIESVKAHLADGFDFADVFPLILELVERVVRIVGELDGTNAEKRVAILDLVDSAYAEFLAPLDLPWVPNLFEGVIDRVIGQVIHAAVDAALKKVLPDSLAPNPGAAPAEA